MARALLSLLFVFAASGSAQAEIPGLVLHWSAPAACPTQVDLEARIERLRDPLRLPDQPSVVTATASRAAADWRLEATVTVAGEQPFPREMSASTCAALADALAVVASVAIRQGAPRSTPPPVASFPLGLAIRLDGLGDAGSLPALSVAVGLAVTARAGPLRLEATGRIWPGASTALSGGSGGDFGLVAAALSGCYADGDAVTLGFCAGIELGSESATGTGVDDPSTEQTLWAAALGRALAEMTLFDPIHLQLAAEIAVVLVRPRFVLDGIGEIHERGGASGRVILGVGVHFQ